MHIQEYYLLEYFALASVTSLYIALSLISFFSFGKNKILLYKIKFSEDVTKVPYFNHPQQVHYDHS